ncbi:MAG: hypothetical protein Q8P11_03845 [bacterium]|nr:hypothetical protein [bacterium]
MKRAIIKTERREILRQKKNRVAGGGFSAQAKREQVNKGYIGLAKGVKKSILSRTNVRV